MSPPHGEGPASRQAGTHLREYWKVLRQGQYTVLAVFLLVVAVTAVYTYLQTPIYRATAIVEVQPKPTSLAPGQDVSGLGSAGYGWWAEEKYHNTQVQVIGSRDVARRAFESLGLQDHPMFAEASDPIDAFRKRVQVDPRRETGLIEISISGADRYAITEWANAVAEAYVRRNLDKAKDKVEVAIETIRGQIEPLETDLQNAEEDRMDLLREKQVIDPASQAEIVQRNLAEYHRQRTESEGKVGRLQNTLNKIRELLRDGADPATLPELANDPTLQDLNRQKVALQREIEAARVRFRPNHPTLAQKAEELDTVERRIDEQVSRIVASLRNQEAVERRNLKDIESLIARAEQVSRRVGEVTSQYEIRSTQTETKKHIYELIAGKMNEVALAQELLSNNISLLDRARVPLHPLKPRKKVNLMVGAMMGLFLGVGLVFFLDYLDNTFRTPQDIEDYLGLSVLGVIPKFDQQEAGSRAVKEAFQSLRTSLIFSSKNRSRKVVLTTSTGPQEGKSSSVANLGRVLAGSGDRVIVVDCDLRRPTQHQHLDLARDRGLTNYLAAPEGETDWQSYVLETNTRNLHAIVCGPIPPSPPELLGSERFRALVRQLRERYDWVLIDSPPAASLADASLLATLVDMVVLVVRHNHTDRDLVIRTAQQIRALNAPLVGAVMNNVDIGKAFSKDYYYAGYYYYTEGADGRKRKSGDVPRVKARAG